MTLTSSRSGFSMVLVAVFLAGLLLAAGSAFLLASAMAVEEPPAAEQEAQPQPSALADYVLVPFGSEADKESNSIVVNLAEARLTRYLYVTITLEVHKDDADAVRKLVQNGKSAVFKDWLLSHLSDKTLEEVKGGQSIARLRREILDGFNSIFVELGVHKIEGVLFEEFYVH